MIKQEKNKVKKMQRQTDKDITEAGEMQSYNKGLDWLGRATIHSYSQT